MAEENTASSVLKQFEPTKAKGSKINLFVVVGFLVLVVAGGLTGKLLAGGADGEPQSAINVGEYAEIASGPGEVGIKDDKVFKDSAQGRIEPNDFSKVQEGTHLLIRPGGPSQTAYLTSSIIDLTQFEGKCVEIWGETFSSQKAGWLMDVGRLKTLGSCPEGL